VQLLNSNQAYMKMSVLRQNMKANEQDYLKSVLRNIAKAHSLDYGKLARDYLHE
jgi:hypothetical protein